MQSLTSSPYATKKGTEMFFEQHNIHPEKIRKLDELSLSALSMGTHSGDADDATDEDYISALVLGVSHGINAIDTASNYRSQRSEKMMPKILRRLLDFGITRDQIILSSKAGFIPDSNNTDNHEVYIRSRYIEKGILRQKDILSNCYSISPKFLAEEIDNSLHRMGLTCLDIYYLHNPEMVSLCLGEQIFEEKMYAALELLEKKVQEKKIRRYGVSTWNGFRQKPGSKGLLQLEKLCEFATSIAGEENHFRVIQLPLNLVMLEALKTKNQKEEKTILEVAEEKNIHVIISSPLMQARVLSLPKRIFAELPKEISPAMQALQFVISGGFPSTVVDMKEDELVHANVKVLQRPDWDRESLLAAGKMLGL